MVKLGQVALVSVAAKADNGETETDQRILTRRKANYSQVGDEIKLVWQRGVLVPIEVNGGTAFDRAKRSKHSEDIFLHLLDRCSVQNIPVSNSPNATNYAPKVFSKRPERDGCSKADLDKAMNNLFASGTITMAPYGRKGDERHRIERAKTGS